MKLITKKGREDSSVGNKLAHTNTSTKFDPQNPWKKLGTVLCAYSSSTGKVEIGDSLGHTAQSNERITGQVRDPGLKWMPSRNSTKS